MKDHFFLILLAFALSVWHHDAFAGMVMTPGTPTHTHSDGNTGGGSITPTSVVSSGGVSGTTGAFSGTLSSTKACSSGYTRVTPNYCHADLAGSTLLVRDACTTVSPSIAGSKAFLVYTSNAAYSANAIASRYSLVASYTDNTCATVKNNMSNAQAYEFTALATSTSLALDANTTIVGLDGGGSMFLQFGDDVGNLGTCYYYIVGYFD